jgi:hypothetical protein
MAGTKKGGGSGEFGGAWRLRDGRIAERYCQFGWLLRLAVWHDQVAYDSYCPADE